jgi:hypothetical protein
MLSFWVVWLAIDETGPALRGATSHHVSVAGAALAIVMAIGLVVEQAQPGSSKRRPGFSDPHIAPLMVLRLAVTTPVLRSMQLGRPAKAGTRDP